MNEVPSVKEYMEAFEALEDDLPESYRKILEAHYAMPDRDITATQLYQAVGYANFNSSNLHYGKLGRRVGREVGWRPNMHMEVMVTFEKREGEWHWIMRPEVAEALELLGWVGNDVCNLKAVFDEFRRTPVARLTVRTRRERARQLRELLSDPESVDLDTFNREVWVHDSGTRLTEGSHEGEKPWDVEAGEWEAALKRGNIEFHGNNTFGNATKVYGAGLKIGADEKLENVRRALRVINDDSFSPVEKARQIDMVPGFGDNVSTGMVMVFHPDEFAIRNKQSRGALGRLKCDDADLESFQQSVRTLSEKLGADDFLELDWFLLHVNNGWIDVENLTCEEEGEGDTMNPLNTILFGPPGTGKTYTVQRKAVEIIEPSAANLTDEEIGEKFRAYREDGQIEFVTFHPSFSYEEFVEGFRYNEEQKVPALHDGVFKEICERAINPNQRREVKEGARIWKVSLGSSDQPHIFERCIESNEIAIGWMKDQNLSENLAFWEEQPRLFEDQLRLLFEENYPGEDRRNDRKSVNYFVNEIRDGDYVAVLKNQHEIRAIGLVAGAYRFKDGYSEYRHTRPVEWLNIEDHRIYELNELTRLSEITIYPLKRVSLQEFIALLPASQRKEDKPYVLVIDEINRGNISRIFGELITLLETDKRHGAENELSTRLPYSGEDFAIPKNLHVIGTMNTADRSIALLDVALRRRFEFEEMMPRVDVVRKVLTDKEADVDVDLICSVFEVLNARITALLDRDHQIGHSYFLGATSAEGLWHALYRRVFPLLQEYFYNDPAQLRRLLGKYDAGEGSGFIENSVMDFGKGDFSLDTESDDAPWKFHKYEADEIEDALRRTFLEG